MLGRMFGTKIGGEVEEKWRKYEDLNILLSLFIVIRLIWPKFLRLDARGKGNIYMSGRLIGRPPGRKISMAM
jgi:hypothetical protein